MTNKKKRPSKIKVAYLAIIVFLPLLAGMALQLVPREQIKSASGGQHEAVQCLAVTCGNPTDVGTTQEVVGWPASVNRSEVDNTHVFTLLGNTVLIAMGTYSLVFLSASARRKFLNQAPDGTPLKKSRRKKS